MRGQPRVALQSLVNTKFDLTLGDAFARRTLSPHQQLHFDDLRRHAEQRAKRPSAGPRSLFGGGATISPVCATDVFLGLAVAAVTALVGRDPDTPRQRAMSG